MNAFGFPVAQAQLAPGLAAIPVRTPLVRTGDDLAALVAAAVRGITSPGAVVVVSETAVAIAQGRSVAAETIRPSKLAYLLAARAGALATINQPESLQLVIDDVGALRVIFAAIAQVFGRVIGRRGVFYEVLGESISAIDGYTGTLPPFDRTIVFGPERPNEAAQEIADRCGAACAIVDANDLGRVNVLGASARVARDVVDLALRDNPHGNGDEQTPVVILTWRGQGQNPLLLEAA